MDIEAAFTAYLLTRTGLTASIDRRLHADETPQDVDLSKQTAVVYSQVSPDEKLHTHDGQNALESPYYQFTVYAPGLQGRPTAKSISAQLKAALCDYVGTMGGLEIQYIKLTNELYDTQHPGDGVSVSTCDLEFEINYVRS